jgi:periplasmic divalent cation tolerance protein
MGGRPAKRKGMPTFLTGDSPKERQGCFVMRSRLQCTVALVTAPDLKTARRLAKAALCARLIACANLVPRIESHYRWQGKLERGSEVLMLLKTTPTRLAALEKLILAEHPYDTAEFIVLPLRGGARRYLDWITESCR